MKKIISYFKEHLREDFNPGYYLFTGFFLTIAIYINYLFDFEDSVIDKHYGESIRIVYYFLFYAFAYYSRNIWGGVSIHMGIAWLMELFAFLHNRFMAS